MSEKEKQEALARAADLLGGQGPATRQVLGQIWDLALSRPLAALDELQDRFCVCMK